jgi:hypothetical protein
MIFWFFTLGLVQNKAQREKRCRFISNSPTGHHACRFVKGSFFGTAKVGGRSFVAAQNA